MTHLQMTILGIGFIFLMTTLGAALVFCFKKQIPSKVNAILLGLAAGVMFAASIWSLLLPAMELANITWGKYRFLPIGFGFLIGGIFLVLLDKLAPYFSKGKQREKYVKGKALARSIKLFVAVTLHNIPEGLAVGFAFGAAYAANMTSAYVAALGLAVGMGLQNFPEGAAVALPIRMETNSKMRAFLCGVVSGGIEPIFAVIGFFLASYLQYLQPWLLSFSAGAMIYVVIEELLPESNAEGNVRLGAWGFMFGFLLMMFLDVTL